MSTWGYFFYDSVLFFRFQISVFNISFFLFSELHDVMFSCAFVCLYDDVKGVTERVAIEWGNLSIDRHSPHLWRAYHMITRRDSLSRWFYYPKGRDDEVKLHNVISIVKHPRLFQLLLTMTRWSRHSSVWKLWKWIKKWIAMDIFNIVRAWAWALSHHTFLAAVLEVEL